MHKLTHSPNLHKPLEWNGFMMSINEIKESAVRDNTDLRAAASTEATGVRTDIHT